MFAVNTALAFSAAMVLVDWTSGEMIMYNTQKFMIDVMKNDDSWAELLNVSIKVDVETVSATALSVLEGLRAVTPELIDELETRSSTEPDDEKTTVAPSAEGSAGKTAETQKTVREVNALHVVADVVSLHVGEGDALEFGLAAIAAAVKCDVLQHVAVQAHAIALALDTQSASTNAVQSSAVWDALVLYMDKLARLKESLAVEFKLYQTWTTVVENLVAGTLKADHLEPFRNLVDESRQPTCGNFVLVEQVPEKLGFNKDVEHWKTNDGINAIFVKSQTSLDAIFKQLPINTMSRDLWDVYFNRTELSNKLADMIQNEQNEGFILVEKSDS